MVTVALAPRSGLVPRLSRSAANNDAAASVELSTVVKVWTLQPCFSGRPVWIPWILNTLLFDNFSDFPPFTSAKFALCYAHSGFSCSMVVGVYVRLLFEIWSVILCCLLMSTGRQCDATNGRCDTGHVFTEYIQIHYRQLLLI